MKKLTNTLLALLFAFQIHATHNRSGEITVHQTGPFSVEASIITYTKASSIPPDRDTLSIRWGDGIIQHIPRTNGNGEYIENDIKVNIYTASHTYATPGAFIIGMMDPNRNAGILNVNAPNSDDVPFYIETSFTLISNWQNNHSPVFLEPAVDVAFVGQAFVQAPNAYDEDGDSLSYEFQTPLMMHDEEVPNYQALNLIAPGPNNTISLNPETGLIIWNAPQLTGEYNFAIKVRSFRNGLELESIVRDIQVIVYEDDGMAPVIVQLNNVNTNITPVSLGDTISIDWEITEPDIGQTLWVSSSSGLYDYFNEPATFSYSVDDLFATAHFEWIVKEEHLREQPYQIVIKAKGVVQEFGLAEYLIVRYRTDFTTGIHAPKKDALDFQLSPNPSINGYVQINLNLENLDVLNYSIYNAGGALISNGKIVNTETKIDIQQLSSGWYSMTIDGEKVTGSKLFFVQ